MSWWSDKEYAMAGQKEDTSRWREGVLSLHDLYHAIFCRGKPDPKYWIVTQRCRKCGAWREVGYSGAGTVFCGPSEVHWFKSYPGPGEPILNKPGD